MGNLIRKTITIDDKIYKNIKRMNPKANFSDIVRKALSEYIENMNIQEALNLKGTWQNDIEDSVKFVDELRKDNGRQIGEWSNS